MYRAIVGAVALLSLAAPAAADVGPCAVFPADSYFNADISQLPKHAMNKVWRDSMQVSSANLKPNFGGTGGYPWITVTNSEPLVNITFDHDDESDAGPYPHPNNIPIGPRGRTIVINTDSCLLYETAGAVFSGGQWSAEAGAIFDLNSYALRTQGWRSADEGGLPIFPLLLRCDELMSGTIEHALRFTMRQTAPRHVWPARHHVDSTLGRRFPPLGARFRLKQNFDISGFTANAQVALVAMKTYGIVLADRGPDWQIQGEQNQACWDPTGIANELRNVPARAFEAVDVSSLKISGNSMQVPP